MLTITKHMGEFAAAHTLTQHQGGCGNLHGHNYGVEVTLIGNYQNSVEGNPESGMIIDFTTLKELYKKRIHEVVDHATIVGTNKPHWYQMFCRALELSGDGPDFAEFKVDAYLGKVAHLDIPETTAEYFAKWILETLDAALLEHLATLPRENRLLQDTSFFPDRLPTEIMVYSVSVWETSTSKATYTNPTLSPGLSARFGGA